MAAQRGFTDLPRAGQQVPFAFEIGGDENVQVAFHADYFCHDWKLVTTFFLFIGL
jgi:hypothetical protein